MNGQAPIYKYDFQLGVVQYLQTAVENQQIRGEQAARNLIAVKELLANPANSAEFEKEKLEELKAKHEPIVKKDDKKEEKK